MYSKEFRREVLSACDAGGRTREVATRFEVSESWVRRIKQERRESGKTTPKTTRDRDPSWKIWSDWLRESIADQPDIYLHELQTMLEIERGRCKRGRCYWRFWLVRSRVWRRLVRRERRAADLVFASLVRICSWDSGCSASQ